MVGDSGYQSGLRSADPARVLLGVFAAAIVAFPYLFSFVAPEERSAGRRPTAQNVPLIHMDQIRADVLPLDHMLDHLSAVMVMVVTGVGLVRFPDVERPAGRRVDQLWAEQAARWPAGVPA